MGNTTTSLVMACALIASAHSAASAEPANNAWSGFYVGAHGGYGWEVFADGEGDPVDLKGALGGIHGGYLWQWQQIVAGVEGDFTFSDVNLLENEVDANSVDRVKAKTDWLASFRGRLGYELGPALLYGTAGIAWTEWSAKGTYQNLRTGNTNVLTAGSTGLGWVIGGGAEISLTDHVTARVEGLHYRFDSLDYNYVLNGTTVSWDDGESLDSKITVVRGGLSLRF